MSSLEKAISEANNLGIDVEFRGFSKTTAAYCIREITCRDFNADRVAGESFAYDPRYETLESQKVALEIKRMTEKLIAHRNKR